MLVLAPYDSTHVRRESAMRKSDERLMAHFDHYRDVCGYGYKATQDMKGNSLAPPRPRPSALQ